MEQGIKPTGALTGLPGNDAFVLFLIFILLLLAVN